MNQLSKCCNSKIKKYKDMYYCGADDCRNFLNKDGSLKTYPTPQPPGEIGTIWDVTVIPEDDGEEQPHA